MPQANTARCEPLRTRVEQAAGVSSAPCFQCNRCTAGCPLVFAMDLTPAQVVHALRLGQEEKVLHSNTIWICLSCETCTTRCPQEVDVDKLMMAARIVAKEQEIVPKVDEIPTFYESYMENMFLFGRIGELPLIMTLKLKEQNFFDDFALGIDLLARGRLKLLDLPEGGAVYRKVYERTLEKEQSK